MKLGKSWHLLKSKPLIAAKLDKNSKFESLPSAIELRPLDFGRNELTTRLRKPLGVDQIGFIIDNIPSFSLKNNPIESGLKISS